MKTAKTNATAADWYGVRDRECRELLDDIKSGLKAHKERTDGRPNWGSVGDLTSIKETLRDLADRLHKIGEYAN